MVNNGRPSQVRSPCDVVPGSTLENFEFLDALWCNLALISNLFSVKFISNFTYRPKCYQETEKNVDFDTLASLL